MPSYKFPSPLKIYSIPSIGPFLKALSSNLFSIFLMLWSVIVNKSGYIRCHIFTTEICYRHMTCNGGLIKGQSFMKFTCFMYLHGTKPRSFRNLKLFGEWYWQGPHCKTFPRVGKVTFGEYVNILAMSWKGDMSNILIVKPQWLSPIYQRSNFVHILLANACVMTHNLANTIPANTNCKILAPLP